MNVTRKDVSDVLDGRVELIPDKDSITRAVEESSINRGHSWDITSFAYGLETGMIIAIKKLGREDLLFDT